MIQKQTISNGENMPDIFTLTAEILSRLSRLFFSLYGVDRGYLSFQRERSEIMKVDEWLISTKELPWQMPISLCRHGSMNDLAMMCSMRNRKQSRICVADPVP